MSSLEIFPIGEMGPPITGGISGKDQRVVPSYKVTLPEGRAYPITSSEYPYTQQPCGAEAPSVVGQYRKTRLPKPVPKHMHATTRP